MTRATRSFRARVKLRSMIDRMNRRLKGENRAIKSPRGRGGDTRVRAELGNYYIVNPQSEGLLEHHVTVTDLEKLARDLGAMKPWEELER